MFLVYDRSGAHLDLENLGSFIQPIFSQSPLGPKLCTRNLGFVKELNRQRAGIPKNYVL